MRIDNKSFSAYQGNGWTPRESSLHEEILNGEYWSHYWSDSEYLSLKAVLLFLPSALMPSIKNANDIQHISTIDFIKLHDQLSLVVQLYSKLGIAVHYIDPEIDIGVGNSYKKLYNLMFVRDLFFMTPEGAIISRMASKVRAGEERFASIALSKLGIPILKTVSGSGTFEGADALWLNKQTVLVGVGNRTNKNGFDQIRDCLIKQGIKAIRCDLSESVQHLLGQVQILDKDLAIVRKELIPLTLRRILLNNDFKIIELNENTETAFHQSMNFVTVSPRAIVMISHNPVTKKLLMDAGITIVTEVDVDELLKAAGGIGCLTGILHRF